MTFPLKVTSATLTALLVLGAFLIGGGTPLSPKKIADATTLAAENSKIAAENTEKAVDATRALATIAENVRAQLDLSKQLLDIQLGLEESSREGAERAKALEKDIAAIGAELDDLEQAARQLSDASAAAGEQVDALAGSAADLDTAIESLQRKFDKVVKESRELNRKARGFEKLKDPIP